MLEQPMLKDEGYDELNEDKSVKNEEMFEEEDVGGGDD